MLAISRRSPLGEPVTDILVERGDRPVVLATASNPSARLSDTRYKTLVSRSAGDDELTTCVALRPDIPHQHLLRLLVRASHAVQLKLEAAHPAMAQTIQKVVAEAATRILDESGALPRNYAAARAHVSSLHSAGGLDESAVAAFAADNKFEETTAALATLCGLLASCHGASLKVGCASHRRTRDARGDDPGNECGVASAYTRSKFSRNAQYPPHRGTVGRRAGQGTGRRPFGFRRRSMK